MLAKPVKSEWRVELQARNEFFKISLLNISLGGGRSILLSYWGVCDYHCNQKRITCQHFPVENVPVIAYTVRSVLERRLYYDRIDQRIPGLGRLDLCRGRV